MRDRTRRLTTSTLRADGVVGKVPEKERRDYKIVLRRPGERGKLLLPRLAGARPPGVEDTTDNDLPHRVDKQLDTDANMLATREMLQGGMWLKCTVRARLEEDQSSLPAQCMTMEGEDNR